MNTPLGDGPLCGVALAALFIFGACTAVVTDGSSARSEGSAGAGTGPLGGSDTGGAAVAGSAPADPGKQPTIDECASGQPFLAPSVIRRLTRFEYSQTLRDLLGDDRDLGGTLAPENRNNGFDNQATSQNVQRDDVLLWEAAAQKVAVSASGRLGCDFASPSADDCLAEALVTTAGRLFRHALDTEQAARYREFFAARRAAGASSARAAELSLTAMLLSPSFLYLVEPASDGQVRVLDSYEVAARLSYSLTRSAPDAELWEAARADALGTAEAVRLHAERLISGPGGERAVSDFYFQWSDGPGVDALVIPDGFDDSLRLAAQEEIRGLVRGWFANSTARIADLFTTRKATVTEQLARYYGLPAGAGGDVELPSSERAGLLTRAVFVGTHPLPPTRGDFVLNRVLCKPVPPPPVVPPDPMELGEFDTQRALFEAHAKLACAKGCHGVLDPVGFPFEHYDAAGRYREEDNGYPVDAATVLAIPGADELNGPVKDALELSAKIADSRELLTCQAEHWFRYAYARLPAPVDRCSLDALSTALIASQGEVRKLLVELTQTDAFRYVRKEAP